MPPKIKITREEVVSTAVALVRAEGINTLNARALARALHCSTQPIFSNFPSMNTLLSAVVHTAYEHYLAFIKREVDSQKYPPYKAFGMAYIRFAKDEKELFKLLFMQDRTAQDLMPTTVDFEQSVELIMQANGLSKEQATLMHLELWSCSHGIATMFATSFLSLDWDLISDMLTDVYQGLRVRFKEKNNERN